MRSAAIVLDLGFGDAGKGKTVDWLCANPPVPLHETDLVVRFSGGQQAGHTVMHGGKKHIHSSFPSGTLRGVEGYIEKDCVVSPIHMMNEWNVLKEKNPSFYLNVHPLAHLTTPYEIAYNKVMSQITGHGTCGLGVGPTMRRNLQTPYHLYAVDLTNDWVLEKKIENLGDYYTHLIAEQFKKVEDRLLFQEIIEELFPLFWEAIEWFNKYVHVTEIDYAFYRGVVFEGSQGILLDMDHGIFPYVTYANTTSKNIADLIRKSGAECHTFYVTRTYATRHGNGPLKDETSDLEIKNNEEEINVENEWQGKFRLAPLDISMLEYARNCDDAYSPSRYHHLCVTCVDQHPISEELYNHAQYYDLIFKSDTPMSVYKDME